MLDARIDIIQPRIRNLITYLLPLPDKKPTTAVVKRDKTSRLDRNHRQKCSCLQRTLLIRKVSIKYCLLLLCVRLKISCISQTMSCMQGRTYPLGKGRRLPWAPKSQWAPKKLFIYEMRLKRGHANGCGLLCLLPRQPSACPSWTCFLCILLVANENIMHLKLTAARARGLSFPAHAYLSLSLCVCSVQRAVKTQICCFSNFTCKYSRNHSTAIVFILCVAYLILSDDGTIINQDFCAD